MLLTADLTESYWEEARKTACYLYNHSPSAHAENNPISPYEQYYGNPPHLSHLKVFGSRCYPTNLVRDKSNHEAKAWEGIFVGYQEQQPVGWKIFIPKTQTFVITAHASWENLQAGNNSFDAVRRTNSVMSNDGHVDISGLELDSYPMCRSDTGLDESRPHGLSDIGRDNISNPSGPLYYDLDSSHMPAKPSGSECNGDRISVLSKEKSSVALDGPDRPPLDVTKPSRVPPLVSTSKVSHLLPQDIRPSDTSYPLIVGSDLTTLPLSRSVSSKGNHAGSGVRSNITECLPGVSPVTLNDLTPRGFPR